MAISKSFKTLIHINCVFRNNGDGKSGCQKPIESLEELGIQGRGLKQRPNLKVDLTWQNEGRDNYLAALRSERLQLSVYQVIQTQ